MAKPDAERIPPQVRAKLESLPGKNDSRALEWTTEQDALILYGWRKKRQADVARLVGRHVNTCRARFEYLIAQQDAERARKAKA